MTVVRWIFTDLSTSTSETFEINPRDGGTPAYEKNFQYTSTAAPNGKTLVFEGIDKPQTIEFSGVILTQTQFNLFYNWWNKRNQIRITDDLGRQFVVVMESFAPVRKRAIHYPWRHDYTIKATVVNWP